MKNRSHSKNAFSIIEVLIGIFIFSMGLVSVYALISSIIQLNVYNKNYILSTYLANEQIELVRTIRDTNYAKIQKYNQVNPFNKKYDEVIEPGSYYKVQNYFSSNKNDFSVVLEKIEDFSQGKENIKKMESYRICLNDESYYVYCSSWIGDLKKTNIYKYLFVESLKDSDGNIIEGALKLNSKVIWNQKGYHDYELKYIITDWKVL